MNGDVKDDGMQRETPAAMIEPIGGLGGSLRWLSDWGNGDPIRIPSTGTFRRTASFRGDLS
jgi:hypothetical protein